MKNHLSISSQLASTATVCLCSLMTTPFIVAAQVLDQGFQPAGQVISTGPTALTATAQTFTVGLGGIFTRFDVYISGTGARVPVLWDIRPTIGGVPVESETASLASGTFPSTAAPQNYWGFYTINLDSAGIAVSPGEVLSIVFSPTPGYNGDPIGWLGEEPDPYKGGYAFVGTPVGIADPNAMAWSTSYLAGYDLGFRTYVVPVPEPSAAFFFFVGVSMILCLRQRHHGRPRYQSWSAHDWPAEG